MRSLSSGLLAIAPLALAACGGKVYIDPTGTGGDGGGGASSSSASSSSASSSNATSSSSASSSSASTGTGVSCPEPFPGIHASCPVEGQICSVPLSCCNGSAVCKDGLWFFLASDCNQDCDPDCGPDAFACVPGALCVTYIGPITTYQCRKSPCDDAITCGCAEPFCDEQGMTCNNIQDGYKVLCD
jgi:hypothetical protein